MIEPQQSLRGKIYERLQRFYRTFGVLPNRLQLNPSAYEELKEECRPMAGYYTRSDGVCVEGILEYENMSVQVIPGQGVFYDVVLALTEANDGK